MIRTCVAVRRKIYSLLSLAASLLTRTVRRLSKKFEPRPFRAGVLFARNEESPKLLLGDDRNSINKINVMFHGDVLIIFTFLTESISNLMLFLQLLFYYFQDKKRLFYYVDMIYEQAKCIQKTANQNLLFYVC